jgi:hypothetical protein
MLNKLYCVVFVIYSCSPIYAMEHAEPDKDEVNRRSKTEYIMRSLVYTVEKGLPQAALNILTQKPEIAHQPYCRIGDLGHVLGVFIKESGVEFNTPHEHAAVVDKLQIIKYTCQNATQAQNLAAFKLACQRCSCDVAFYLADKYKNFLFFLEFRNFFADEKIYDRFIKHYKTTFVDYELMHYEEMWFDTQILDIIKLFEVFISAKLPYKNNKFTFIKEDHGSLIKALEKNEERDLKLDLIKQVKAHERAKGMIHNGGNIRFEELHQVCQKYEPQ